MGKTVTEERAALNNENGHRPQPAARTYTPVKLKAAVFDIETLSFQAGGMQSGFVCVSILPLDKRRPQSYYLRFEDRQDDRRLLSEAVEALSEYSVLIGHFVRRFDLQWLTSRLMYHNLPLPPGGYFIDTWDLSRKMGIKSDRRSLAFLLDYFGIPPAKTAIYPVAWHEVRSNDPVVFNKAVKHIVDHCVRDVKDNAKLFDAMWQYVLAYGFNPFQKTPWSGMKVER